MTPKRKTHPAIWLCGGDDRVFPDTSDCRRNDLHTPMPRGFLEQTTWAERMLQTHVQQRCPGCGLWKVWVPREELGEDYDGDEIVAEPPSDEPLTLRITPEPVAVAPPRERCRKRWAASTMRCMGEAGHEGEHWCWKGDVFKDWPNRDSSEVEA